MTQQIYPKVTIEAGKAKVIVRRVTFDFQGKIERKELLQKDGIWIEVPELSEFPPDCVLSVLSIDFVDIDLEKDIEKLQDHVMAYIKNSGGEVIVP